VPVGGGRVRINLDEAAIEGPEAHLDGPEGEPIRIEIDHGRVAASGRERG
jgi:hypothetical protein